MIDTLVAMTNAGTETPPLTKPLYPGGEKPSCYTPGPGSPFVTRQQAREKAVHQSGIDIAANIAEAVENDMLAFSKGFLSPQNNAAVDVQGSKVKTSKEEYLRK